MRNKGRQRAWQEKQCAEASSGTAQADGRALAWQLTQNWCGANVAYDVNGAWGRVLAAFASGASQPSSLLSALSVLTLAVTCPGNIVCFCGGELSSSTAGAVVGMSAAWD